MDAVPSLEKEPLDGRTARAWRTRQAVVDALLALIEEGDLRPTAPRIAERAGVSLRSIFQHFSDLEALFAAVAARELARIRDLAVPVPTDLTFAERIDEFVRQRARVLEFMTPVRRAALLQEPFSAELQAARDRAFALARAEVERVFASELGTVPADRRDELVAAVETAAGWPAWESLRTGSGLSEEAAARVVAHTVTALLAPPGRTLRRPLTRSTMDVLRTPDERFRDLPGWPFEPRYVEVPAGEAAGGRLRVHYVDEGPADAEVVLLLHGEPSWSYLYRTMIPIIVDAGLRAVAPDLVGFGRSDKPASRAVYTYQRHVDWMRAAIEGIGLRRITLVGQDWGGLVGLRLAAEDPDRFERIVAANTFLPTGDREPSAAFMAWQRYSQETPVFHVGGIVRGGCAGDLPPEIVAAYDAPFPDESYKEAARQFPVLVPTRPDDPAASANRRAWEVLARWEKPFLTAFSDADPITRGGDRVFQETVPGAAGQAHTTIAGAGHFLQEDRGEELARVVVEFVRSTR